MPKIPDQRPEKLGLNLFDLDMVHPDLRVRILQDRLDLTQAIKIDPTKPDERAVVFRCDLLSAALACDLLWSEARREGDSLIRVYLFQNGRWKRVPDTTTFTALINEQAALNPKVFPWTAPEVPLQIQPIF